MVPSEADRLTPAQHRISGAVWEALACPHCASTLVRADRSMRCDGCKTVFDDSPGGSVDLRLRRAKEVQIEFTLGVDLIPEGFQFDRLLRKPDPEVDFSGIAPPWHLTEALLSYFPKATSPKSVALDLGCGSGLHRGVCERAGFAWAGLDYANPMAPILGDGHALPFRSNSIEFVLSMAVLEHIRYPLVLAREVMRVLKPGGFYIGTVSFLEPFHGDSYYHHSHLGTYNTLDSAGFEIMRVAPNATWSGLRAQATMSLFPRLPGPLPTALVWPIEALHWLWWRTGRLFSAAATEQLRLNSNTGTFEFVARKRG